MTRHLALWPLAAAFAFAGFIHITRPGFFQPIVPSWVPLPRETVILTGACEIAGAIGLVTRRLRWWASLMLALYSACVFPANVKHALDYAHGHGFGPGWLYHGPRLLFQPVIIWWCLYAARVIDWPFKARGQADPPLVHRPPGPKA